MSKYGFIAAFVLGAVAVVWVGAGYLGTNALALLMTALIAAVYLLGAYELFGFRRATQSLHSALAAIPQPLPDLSDWLARINPTLRHAVRNRIDGDRAALPGPALTPYLVGLLVMLGMLGTFLGMVVTLNGAVLALQGSTDLQAMRAALAAPVRGLGLAFGTSVAGVAASAMLGLMSALCRRERVSAGQALDAGIAGRLRACSLAHQRQETYKALQHQAGVLPDVVETLQALMLRMERMDQRLSERLLENQQTFHAEARDAYTRLANSVERSLKDSLSESARAAGDTIQPAVQAAMSAIARETQTLHEKLVASTQAQLDGIAARLGASADTRMANQAAAEQQRLMIWTQALESTATTLRDTWQRSGADMLARQQEICAALEHNARDLREHAQAHATATHEATARLADAAAAAMTTRQAADAASQRRQAEQMDALLAAWRAEIGALRNDETARGNAAIERLSELQAAVAAHLTTLGRALEEPIARLVQSASDAPRAAAELIAQLRQDMTRSVARDNELLREQSHILAALDRLVTTIGSTADAQRCAIDGLIQGSAERLAQSASQFAEKVAQQSGRLEDSAAQIAGGAVEMSSLGDAFAHAVQLFHDGNQKLMANLQNLEAALDKSAQRSDEQLAYYVAQAREVIDLSIMSQKEIVDALRALKGSPALLAGAVN